MFPSNGDSDPDLKDTTYLVSTQPQSTRVVCRPRSAFRPSWRLAMTVERLALPTLGGRPGPPVIRGTGTQSFGYHWPTFPALTLSRPQAGNDRFACRRNGRF